MSTPEHVEHPRFLPRLLSVLVALQCAGLLLSTLRDTTAVGTVLFVHLRVGEALTLFVDQGAAIFAMAISLAAVTGRVGRGMLWVASWFGLIACAQMYDAGEPYSQWSLAAHATRIALPLAAYAAPRLGSVPWLTPQAFRWGLRIAVALTFAAHGSESLAGHPRFIDYILSADRKLISLGLTELLALDVMTVIGLVDLTIAFLVMTGRDFRFALIYAAGWGVITAFARIVHMDVHYPQALLRVANAGLPLALLLSGRNCVPRRDVWAPRSVASALRPLVGMLFTVVSGGALFLGLESAPTEAADITPGQLRVIWLEHPNSEAVVAWSTDLSGTNHQVLFDTVSRDGETQAYRFSAKTTRNAQYASSSRYYHHAPLDRLSASTTYYFVVVSDGVASKEHHFVTAPRDEREIKLLYGGDSRSDRGNRQRVNDLIRGQVEADPAIVAFAHGGDYVEDGTDFDQWNEWLDDYQRTVTADGRILPLVPARGNHEASGSLYGQVFAFPGINENNYFVSELSPQIAFIVLNSNASQAGDQRTFLESELDLRSRDTRWLLASYHEPAYSAVKSPGGALVHWVPLFEQYGVDLVCESDGHVLKRTYPMRAGKRVAAEDGVVYIGEGGLGVDQRTPNGAPYLAMSRSAHHIQLLTFRPDRLHYEAITLDGEIADSIDRFPRREGKAPPARLISATALSNTTTVVRFDKPLDMDFALQADRYKLAPTGSVLSALESGEPTTILLTTSALPPGQYTLSVDGIVDLDGLSVSSQTSLLVTDGDGQGMLDDTPCPAGSKKALPGQCGCDAVDIDTDGDGIADCIDGCPDHDSKVKADQCGCAVADVDRDGDGIADCIDGCPDDATKDEPGACGCGTKDDACAFDKTDSLGPVSGTYGCSTSPRPATGPSRTCAAVLMVLGVCLLRRRRR